MTTEVKSVADQIAAAFEEFKAEHKRQIEEVKKGINDPQREEKLQKINTRLDELQAQKDEIEKKLNRPNQGDQKAASDLAAETKSFNDYRKSFATGHVADISTEQYDGYKAAFWELARKGSVERLSDTERKALQAGVDSDGGYLLPTPTVGRVVSKVYELSPIRQIASVQNISTSALEGIIDNDEASYGWVSETGARTETNTPTVGKYRIEAFEMYAAPKATQTLLDDAAVDVEAWLAGKQADKFARVEGSAFINGTGVGQPRGFATYTTAATGDATRAWGTIEHVVTGANGAFHTTQADPLFSLIQAFKTAYLQGASWVTTREIIAAIRKFKTSTTNEYIWQPGLQMGQPSTLLGYPVVIAQDMPVLATNSLSMALGNFKEAYQIVDRQGIRTLRDPFTSKPYVIFYSTRRVGGAVVNFEAMKFIKFST
jgi:HK97 family phage major capsid protein